MKVLAAKILAVSMLALGTGACSIAVGVAGLEEDEPIATGTVVPRAAVPLSAHLNEEDWRRAKAALAVALDPQGPGTLVSWDNPQSAMKGSFTPTGAPYVKDDEICRGFSSVLSGAAAETVKGTACRPSGGEWSIKAVNALKAAPKPRV